MTDLEKMALQRDRGFLVRLVLVLAVGIALGCGLFAGLTGRTVGGCMAEAFVGESPSPETPGTEPTAVP